MRKYTIWEMLSKSIGNFGNIGENDNLLKKLNMFKHLYATATNLYATLKAKSTVFHNGNKSKCNVVNSQSLNNVCIDNNIKHNRSTCSSTAVLY